MEEKKKQIKISLGTAICLVIIVILVIALVGVICYNANKRENKTTNSVNNKLENSAIDNNTEETKVIKEKKPYKKIGKLSASEIVKAKKNALYYTFATERESQCIVSEDKFSVDKKSLTLKKWGTLKFDEKIKEVCNFWIGQGSLDFVVILFEDGTLKYETDTTTQPKDININPEGKIIELYPMNITIMEKEDNNKIEIEEGTIAGIDEYGNIYDLQLYRE